MTTTEAWRRWRAGWARLRCWGHVAIALIVIVALYSGLTGIDFGHHWDEPERIGTLIHALERDEVLPSWYHYPSVVHDLLLISAAPELLDGTLQPAAADSSVHTAALTARLKSETFLLRTRGLFLALSMLTVVAVYAAALRARARPLEAVVAAALVGFSWEFGYHARWIAPDTLTAVAAALVLCGLQGLAPGRAHAAWLAAAGAAAGLGFGTKYPSGLLLLPVLLAAVHVGGGVWRRILGNVSLSLAAFVLVYLVTTPGSVLQHQVFLNDVAFEVQHYQSGHRGGHTIASGLSHVWAELSYLSLVVFSPYEPIAALFSLLALGGASWLAVHDRWRAVLLLSFPVVYVGYMGSQKVMMARNLLVVVPFLALLSARGAFVCYHAAGRWPWARSGVALLLGCLLLGNAASLVAAGRSIANPVDPAAALAAFLRDNAEVVCGVTQRVRRGLEGASGSLPSNAVDAADTRARWVALYASEVRNKNLWLANRRDYTVETLGPREVNFNYYPSWSGRNRIVVMRREDALSLRVISGQGAAKKPEGAGPAPVPGP